MEIQVFSVKCGLNSKCIDKDLLRQIQLDVVEMSKLLVEMSIYTHYMLNKNWRRGDFTKPKFLDYFYALSTTGKQSRKNDTIDTGYRNLRQGNVKNIANRSNKSNPIVFAAKQYQTIFNNNISMHAYSRIKRFLNLFDKDKKRLYETLDYLFNSSSTNEPNAYLIDRMVEYLQYDYTRILTIKTKPYDHIRLFYTLQRFNSKFGLRNFALIPIYKHGLHHIRYDTQSLFSCLKGLHKIAGIKREDFTTDQWSNWFKLPESKTHKFHGAISTDGVAVTFSMERPIAKPTKNVDKQANIVELNDESYLNRIKNNLSSQSLPGRNLHYEVYIGLDPGLKLMYGGTERGTIEMLEQKTTIKIKSSKFRSISGAISRKYSHQNITKNIEEDTRSTISPMQTDYEQYTRHRLKWFDAKQDVYGQRKVARLKFKKFICVEAAAHKTVKSIIKHRKALVFIGASKIAANSPMRGYVRSPQRALLKAFRIHADVVLVDEFRTTMLCSQKNCHQMVKTSKSPKRYQFCKNCGTNWNRDVNAGNNILYVGLQKLLQREVHPNLQRGVNRIRVSFSQRNDIHSYYRYMFSLQ